MTDGKLYDKTGREIMRGDIVKVFHFIGARRKRHYMYKQALGIDAMGFSGPDYMKFSHLNLTNDGYQERADGRILGDYEIVQSAKADHEDRPRMKVGGR